MYNLLKKKSKAELGIIYPVFLKEQAAAAVPLSPFWIGVKVLLKLCKNSLILTQQKHRLQAIL